VAKTDRFIPFLIAGLFAAPMLAAWVAHVAWQPRLDNYGELLAPETPSLASLTDATGAPATLAALRGKWLLVTVASHGCDAGCRRNLYLARQIRIAQGKERSRVERILVSDRITEATEDADLRRLISTPDSLRRLTGTAASRTYLLDPLGRTVLRFPEQPDGKRMLRDLQHLLRASKIG
jgi:hypothetical protein